MFSIKRLYDLQETDLVIDAREKRLADVRRRLADDTAVTSARERVAELDLRLQAPSARRRDLELDVQQLTDRLTSVHDRLYSGSITSPRELSAYEADRQHLQKRRGAEEDRLLEVMVEVDELRSARSRAAQELERIDAERRTDVKELEEDERELIAALEALRQSRDGIAPAIPPATLSVYEGLRKSRDGVAVARVVRSMCEGCRLTLPTMELQRAKSAQSIVQCSSCRRILYPV
jgi:predicted  nucleic acid-binding Zn-ribbon protein